MIVVTGGAGFIGSNLVRALNRRGEDDIVIVDDLSNPVKIRNLNDCKFTDYVDKDDFLNLVKKRAFGVPTAIFHQGACSDTREMDGRYMMEVNYNYSKILLHFALEQHVPFIYASSASVYGSARDFSERAANETALNVYAFSKLLFDRHVRQHLDDAGSQVVGLRYFNVYGPGEAHKGSMASVAYHFYNQYHYDGRMRLFVGSDGYSDGEQQRDFIWVDDVADVNLHFLDSPDVSGIFNLGTGANRSFNDVALVVANAHDDSSVTLSEAIDFGKIEYVPFPEGLLDKYQSYTRADVDALRNVGYNRSFTDIEDGVDKYVKRLVGSGL